MIGRPAAQLPYRATHPLDDNAPPDGVLRAHDCLAESGGSHQLPQNEHQEEPQYVTPLPADDMFEGVDAEIMRDAERFGRFRGSNEMAPLDDDNVENDSGGDEEGEYDDDDAANIGEVDDEVDDDDGDDDDDEQNVEEEEDDDANGAEIVLDADNNRFDEDDDDAYGDNARSNGPVTSYHWK